MPKQHGTTNTVTSPHALPHCFPATTHLPTLQNGYCIDTKRSIRTNSEFKPLVLLASQ